METVNAKEGIDTMNTTTAHLTKVGNAYATSDLAYRVTKHDDKAWYLYIADEDRSVYLATVKADALNGAERIIVSRKAEAALPWDRTTKTPAKWWSHKRDYEYGDLNCCQCCGRTVGKNPLGAIIVGGGGEMCQPADNAAFMQNDGGYMGWYPVGSECAKHFPAGYLTTLSGE
jgi:hypothetical protein